MTMKGHKQSSETIERRRATMARKKQVTRTEWGNEGVEIRMAVTTPAERSESAAKSKATLERRIVKRLSRDLYAIGNVQIQRTGTVWTAVIPVSGSLDEMIDHVLDTVN